MSKYRRAQAPGGTFFFTVNLARPGGTLLVDRIAELRAAYAAVVAEQPFETRAAVILPDHMHAIWTLPPGDGDFSTRWKRIKREFSVAVDARPGRSDSKRRQGEAGIWQRRF